MNKFLTLALAFVFALSVNANAEEESTEGKRKHYSKEQRQEAREKGERRHESKKDRSGKDGKRSEHRKEARSECAKKCNINVDKVKQCRKAKNAKKGDSLKGACLSEKAKSCVKSCVKAKKSSMKNKDGKKYHKDAKIDGSKKSKEYRKNNRDSAESSDVE